MSKLLEIKGVDKHFDISGSFLDQLHLEGGKISRKQTVVKAVNNVTLDVLPGETLSVVGESGCGKSTLARTVMGLYAPNKGEIFYRGQRIDNLNSKQMLPYRTKMQMVFQDPYASLNPRMAVREILEEPVRFHNPSLSRAEVKDVVAEIMLQVGVDPKWASNFPHEFSGGQRQRISIARALVLDPEFIAADEPIAALDVSIQAQILNLLMDAQEKRGLTYLFISHDLSVVEHISTRVAHVPRLRMRIGNSQGAFLQSAASVHSGSALCYPPDRRQGRWPYAPLRRRAHAYQPAHRLCIPRPLPACQ